MTSSRPSTPPAEGFYRAREHLFFWFSWLLVVAIGLMPIAEAVLNRSPSITMPATIAFFVAVGSGILLRRRYS